MFLGRVPKNIFNLNWYDIGVPEAGSGGAMSDPVLVMAAQPQPLPWYLPQGMRAKQSTFLMPSSHIHPSGWLPLF